MNSVYDFLGSAVKLIIYLAIMAACFVIWTYNKLRRLAEEVKEAQSNIGVALRKKISLVNQLIDVANKYMDRESLVLLQVSQDTAESAMKQMYQQSGTVLSTIQGLAQRFPELKASEQYTNLGNAIAESEGSLQKFRVQFNRCAKEYNSKRSRIPHVLYASTLGFRPAPYLDLENAEAAEVGTQREVFSDDGDRLNELLNKAGAKVLGATKLAATQGKSLAGKAAAQLMAAPSPHSELSASLPPLAVQYHYQDANRVHKGPVSRAELDTLFRVGAISGETEIQEAGKTDWKKFADMQTTA